MKNIIEESKTFSIKRIIMSSAWGVSDSRKDIPFWFRCTIDFSNIKYAYRDHEKQENLLENSELN